MKKRVFVIALVVCLVAMLGYGTLAYFQASGNLTNFFGVAGIDDPTDSDATIDPETLFSIKLDETDIDNPGQRTEDGNVYAGIMPGDTLVKDPTVTNTGKYAAWIRVKVTVTDAADWTAACQKHGITDLSTIFNGYVDADWYRDPAEDVLKDNALTYTYYYKAPVDPNGAVKLFDSVTIPTELDVNDMASLATWQLQITGEAIQAANTGATAQEAFGLWE